MKLKPATAASTTAEKSTVRTRRRPERAGKLSSDVLPVECPKVPPIGDQQLPGGADERKTHAKVHRVVEDKGKWRQQADAPRDGEVEKGGLLQGGDKEGTSRGPAKVEEEDDQQKHLDYLTVQLTGGGLCRPENAAGQRPSGGEQRLGDAQVAEGHEEGGQDEQQQQFVEGKEDRPPAVRLKAVVGGDGALLVKTGGAAMSTASAQTSATERRDLPTVHQLRARIG
ncbi:hypothetical protein TYRP_011581 [Tyrophagus putrescentiae]|nr:hypothetical protein TYRP_011581 [Tyrophagus putrescentiae]